MTLEWPKNVIEEMTEVLLSLLYIANLQLSPGIYRALQDIKIKSEFK